MILDDWSHTIANARSTIQKFPCRVMYDANVGRCLCRVGCSCQDAIAQISSETDEEYFAPDDNADEDIASLLPPLLSGYRGFGFKRAKLLSVNTS